MIGSGAPFPVRFTRIAQEGCVYHYRLTVEPVTMDVKALLPEGPSVHFQVQNHDDLLKIVEAVRSKNILDEDKSAALAIGLKLFSEIVIEKRGDPLFQPLLEPIQSFIRQLKTVEANHAARR